MKPNIDHVDLYQFISTHFASHFVLTKDESSPYRAVWQFIRVLRLLNLGVENYD